MIGSLTTAHRGAYCPTFLAAAVICVLALGACSDEPAPRSSAGPDLSAVQPCELLAPSEIESATGRAAAAGVDVSQGAVPMCRWPPSGGRDYDTLVMLLVTRHYYDNYDDFLRSVREGPLADAFADEEVTEVEGAGEFAVWMPGMGMLQVYDTDVMVQIDGPSGGDELEVSKELALAALARLR